MTKKLQTGNRFEFKTIENLSKLHQILHFHVCFFLAKSYPCLSRNSSVS